MITFKKSVFASLCIALGVAVQLNIGNPLGALLFSFGLLVICKEDANLFTGKVGFLWRNRFLDLFPILGINLLFGWIFGNILGIANSNLVVEANSRISSWEFSKEFFLQSFFCGVIMYLAVKLYKGKNLYGIFIGVPLFILCGFQHCIANIIILGIGKTFSATIFLCILGNTLGSIFVSIFSEE